MKNFFNVNAVNPLLAKKIEFVRADTSEDVESSLYFM